MAESVDSRRRKVVSKAWAEIYELARRRVVWVFSMEGPLILHRMAILDLIFSDSSSASYFGDSTYAATAPVEL